MEEPEDGFSDQVREKQLDKGPALRNGAGENADQTEGAARITLRLHDPATGGEIDKTEVVKGYEYDRGQFVTFTAEELKALDVESSKIIDLEKFVPSAGIDPVYFDSPNYVYPDGPIAVEALRVIGAAMAEAGVVGLRPPIRSAGATPAPPVVHWFRAAPWMRYERLPVEPERRPAAGRTMTLARPES